MRRKDGCESSTSLASAHRREKVPSKDDNHDGQHRPKEPEKPPSLGFLHLHEPSWRLDTTSRQSAPPPSMRASNGKQSLMHPLTTIEPDGFWVLGGRQPDVVMTTDRSRSGLTLLIRRLSTTAPTRRPTSDSRRSTSALSTHRHPMPRRSAPATSASSPDRRRRRRAGTWRSGFAGCTHRAPRDR
jgi:hypothetical protein